MKFMRFSICLSITPNGTVKRMKAVYLKSHNGMTLFHTYDKEPFRQRVRAFMQSVDGKGGH